MLSILQGAKLSMAWGRRDWLLLSVGSTGGCGVSGFILGPRRCCLVDSATSL